MYASNPPLEGKREGGGGGDQTTAAGSDRPIHGQPQYEGVTLKERKESDEMIGDSQALRRGMSRLHAQQMEVAFDHLQGMMVH